MAQPGLSKEMMSDEDFARLNNDVFDEYIKWRIEGYTPYVSFRRAFGPGYRVEEVTDFANAVEINPYFQNEFQQRLAEMPLDKLWSQKKSINSLLQMVHNPFVKCSTQLSAIKELNVLSNITFVDENGKTRASRGLGDFYASIPDADEDTAAARAEAMKAAGITEPPIAASEGQ